METIPLLIVTVPLPLSTRLTFGPVPVPPPGGLAKTELAANSELKKQVILAQQIFFQSNFFIN
jgi:hypothetical protein